MGFVKRNELQRLVPAKFANLPGRDVSKLIENHDRAIALEARAEHAPHRLVRSPVVGEIHHQNRNRPSAPFERRKGSLFRPGLQYRLMHADQALKRRRITAEIVQKQSPARMFAARSSGASVYVLIQSRQMKES